MKKLSLEKIFSILGVLLIIPAIVMIFFEYCPQSNGDSANWLQAFVAIFTLMAVIYAAIKAKEASDSSAELTEKSYMNNIILTLAEKSNNALSKQTEIERESYEIMDKWIKLYLKSDPYYMDEGGNIPLEAEEEIETLWVSRGGRDKYISEFISNILKADHPISQTTYAKKSFYKELLKTYLHTSAIVEISAKNHLRKISIDFKAHGSKSPYYVQALELEKNYNDAMDFLGIKQKNENNN